MDGGQYCTNICSKSRIGAMEMIISGKGGKGGNDTSRK
jgi:hypothetical protein